ncbi:hypothetical protein C8J57DRAFT_1626190 [Mycena rebaudengoi]|nr:hypothetical protein C8J57DRAFT_1626190 [Mycena rebaudengoi]
MHPALQIAEIVELICIESVDPDDDRDLNTLYALARTASTFTHSALNGLWKFQTTLINILKCLPADLWDVERGLLHEGSSFHLLCPVKQTDLERLLFHSARVKSLDFAEQAVTPGISGLLDQIQPFLPQGFLFPKLRSLFLEPGEERGLFGSHMSLFIPGTLTELYIDLEDNWSRLLPLLPPLKSSFMTLSMDILKVPNHIECSLISTFVRTLDQVTDLEVPTLDPTVLKHVASLATLKSLKIGCAGAGNLSTGLLQPTGFCALTNLLQLRASISAAATCPPNIPCELSVSRSLRASPTARFQTFGCDIMTFKRHRPDNRGFYVHTISLLFCFRGMQILELCAPGGFQLEDVTVWDLAQAFPELRRLLLTTSDGVHYAPRVTLDGLRAFAIHCPQLTAMHIAFNATVILPAIDFTPSNAFHAKLTELDVLDSRISSPHRVTVFLTTIFPILVTLVHYHKPMQEGFTAEDCKKWDQVGDLLSRLADARWKEQLGAVAP